MKGTVSVGRGGKGKEAIGCILDDLRNSCMTTDQCTIAAHMSRNSTFVHDELDRHIH